MNASIRDLARLILALVTASLSADAQHPNVAKGFQADKVYQFNGVDNVNLYNGNLTLNVPIGQSYGGNGTLSYGLTLSYNSKAWDQQIVNFTTGCEPNPGPTTVNDPNCFNPYIRTMPSRRSNAGMGWLLSMGRLIRPGDPLVDAGQQPGPPGWVYESPDGADHILYQSETGIHHSRDGSFLRLVEAGNDKYELQFPDGMIHVFFQVGGLVSPRLAEIWDPFGNFLSITYSASGDWTLTEYNQSFAVVRTHYVRVLDTTTAGPTMPPPLNAPANYDSVVREIDLAAFGGGRAVFTLKYRMDDIPYGCFGDVRAGETSGARVPRLTTVLLPDQSSWKFDYYTGGYCSSLSTMILPTLGKMEWQYAAWQMPTAKCRQALVPDRPFEGDDPFRNSEGVATKTITTPGAPAAVWTYTQKPELLSGFLEVCRNHNGVPMIGQKHQQSRVTVDAPDETRADHLFSVWPYSRAAVGTAFSEFDGSEYGLPFTRATAAEGGGACKLSDSGALCLSSEHSIKVDPDGEGPSLATWSVQRRTFVRYEGDHRVPEHDQYRREAERRTVFVDDGGTFLQMRRSGYDGLGHFRTTRTWSSWSDIGRIEHTNFNPSKPDVVVDYVTWTNTPAESRPPASAKWTLSLFDEKRVSYSDGNGAPLSGTTFKNEFAFDANSGALLRTRTLKSTDGTQSDTDLVTTYGRDALGNVTSEAFYGGDRRDANGALLHSAGVGTLNSLTLAKPPEYRVQHSYQHGSRNYSAYMSGADVVLRLLSATVDQNTGRVDFEHDAAGVKTDYHYDSSGRLLSVTPDGRARSSYEYLPASGTANANVTETVTVKAPGTDVLSTRKFEFDPLGRLLRERVSMPGGQESRRDFTYDAAGRVKTASELGSASAASLPVTDTKYDSFGRVSTVTSPDGSLTTFSYTGLREMTRTASIATSATESTVVGTTQRFDGFGRLTAVVERSGPTTSTSTFAPIVETEYAYDAADRLTSVTMKGTETVQHRGFNYDGRGFLIWESQPESGVSSHTYDSRGHALTSSRGAVRSQFDLRFTYDAAERLRGVDGRNPDYVAGDPARPEFRPMKAFDFATANVVGQAGQNDDLRAGKLLTATRYNYPPPSAGTPYAPHLLDIFKVSDTYSYKDAAGRRTHRTTSITRSDSITSATWTPVREISSNFTYDDLDQPVQTSYPMCVKCAVPPDWNKALGSTYDRGRLSTVAGFVTTPITYWPNGVRNQMTHTNGITDTQEIDQNTMMPRPLAMKSAFYDSCTAPSITTQPVGGRIAAGTPSVTLSVVASGSGVSYKWYANVNGLWTAVAEGPAYTAAPQITTRYHVTVSNRCRVVFSNEVTVSVGGDCDAPWVTASEPSASSDKMWSLRADGGGAGPLTYTWYRESDNAVVGNQQYVTVGPVTQTTSYKVRVTHTCSAAAAEKWVTVTVPLAMATNGLNATVAPAGNAIRIWWTASPGASRYELERRSGASWSKIAQPTAAEYTDPSIELGRTYAYRVRAVDATGGSASPYSNSDVATIMSFTPIAPQQVVSATAFNEMLSAVNSVRAAVGWPAAGWSNIIAPTEPLPQPGQVIRAAHVTSCRARMNEALNALGVPTSEAYTDPDLQGVLVKPVHVQQVQARTQ